MNLYAQQTTSDKTNEDQLCIDIRAEALALYGPSKLGRLCTAFDSEKGVEVWLETHRGAGRLVSGFGTSRMIALRDLQTNMQQAAREAQSGVHSTIPGVGPEVVEIPSPPPVPRVLRSAGQKDDRGKPKWSLLPMRPALEVVRVLTWAAHEKVRSDGSLGYGENNWQIVPNARQRYIDGALRHLTDYVEGKRIDEDSGLHTLAHAGSCILFLLWFELTGQNVEIFEGKDLAA